MTATTTRTIEAVYENGLLRPLEPIQESGDQIFLVTILNINAFLPKTRPQQAGSLRGKYRGYLSSANEFSRNKQIEKTLER